MHVINSLTKFHKKKLNSLIICSLDTLLQLIRQPARLVVVDLACLMHAAKQTVDIFLSGKGY
jgi:hypothetical protein